MKENLFPSYPSSTTSSSSSSSFTISLLTSSLARVFLFALLVKLQTYSCLQASHSKKKWVAQGLYAVQEILLPLQSPMIIKITAFDQSNGNKM